MIIPDSYAVWLNGLVRMLQITQPYECQTANFQIADSAEGGEFRRAED